MYGKRNHCLNQFLHKLKTKVREKKKKVKNFGNFLLNTIMICIFFLPLTISLLDKTTLCSMYSLVESYWEMSYKQISYNFLHQLSQKYRSIAYSIITLFLHGMFLFTGLHQPLIFEKIRVTRYNFFFR